MNQLLKYILVVYLTLIILFGLILIFSSLGKAYGHEIGGGLNEQGQRNLLMFVPNQFFQTISNFFGFLMLYLFPIFIVFMSGLYQFKNPVLQGYFKSLLIPVSYVIIGLLILFTITYRTCVGEECLGVMIILLQLAITFVAVIIINLIILGVKSFYSR